MNMTPKLRARIGNTVGEWIQSLMPTVKSRLANHPMSTKSGATKFLDEMVTMMSSTVSEIICSWPADKNTPTTSTGWAKFMTEVVAKGLSMPDSQRSFIAIATKEIARTGQTRSRGDAQVANILGMMDTAMGMLSLDDATEYLQSVVPALYAVVLEPGSLAALDTRLAQVERGGCFVATAVYGSYDAEAVRVLRLWRDRTLASSITGRIFIRLYYFVGPWLARLVERGDLPARPIRRLLDAVVCAVADVDSEGTPM